MESLRLDLRSLRVCVGQVFLASGSEASAVHEEMGHEASLRMEGSAIAKSC